jgi:LysM repeat protein
MIMFRVEAGETLAILAAKYKTTTEDIIVLNKVIITYSYSTKKLFRHIQYNEKAKNQFFHV